jgi:hypothetical protein
MGSKWYCSVRIGGKTQKLPRSAPSMAPAVPLALNLPKQQNSSAAMFFVKKCVIVRVGMTSVLTSALYVGTSVPPE